MFWSTAKSRNFQNSGTRMPEIENSVTTTRTWRYANKGGRGTDRDYLLAVGAVTLLFIGFSAVYIVRGNINEDEGWYLYASKLVYEGLLPYRDFSFTQGPVLPFVYGVPQAIFGSSLLVGRMTSVAFAVGVLLLTMAIAHRLNGRLAAVLAGLIMVLNPHTVYFLTITKTYALTAFLLSLALFFVVCEYRPVVRYALAALFLSLAAGTRLSVVLALPILWAYIALIEKDRKALLFAVGLSGLIGAITYLPLYILAGDRMIFNVLGHHMGRYETTTIFGAVYSKVSTVRELIAHYPALFIASVVGLAGSAAQWRRGRIRWPGAELLHPAHLCIAGILLAVFAAHFLPGGSYAEYQVPLVPVAAILVGSLSVTLYQQIPPSQERGAMMGGLLFAVLLLSLNVGLTNAKKAGVSDLEEVLDLSRRIKETVPQDGVIYTLHPYLAVQSQRALVPGTEMGIFSFYSEAETRTAHRRRVINDEIAVTIIPRHQPDAVVLMDTDFLSSASYMQVEQAAVRSEIEKQLALCYSPLWNGDQFGQFNNEVTLYLRNPRCTEPSVVTRQAGVSRTAAVEDQ